MPVKHQLGHRQRAAIATRTQRRAVHLVVWLLAGSVVAAAPPPLAAAARLPAAAGVAAIGSTPPTPGSAKPVRQLIACMWLVMGIGGVLLAFASGAFMPVLAVLIAGMALEVCG